MLHKYDKCRDNFFWELNAKIVRFADTRNCLGHSRATPRFYHVKPHCYYRLDVRFQNMFQIDLTTLIHGLATDEVAERLRRWTANPMCSARVGWNAILVVSIIYIFSEHNTKQRFGKKNVHNQREKIEN